MSRLREVTPNQLVLPSHYDVVPLGEYPGIDPEQRISLNRLLGVINETLKPGRQPSVEDYAHAAPETLKRELFIDPAEDRFTTLQHLGRVGVRQHSSGRLTGDYGIVFPPDEYLIVARNPAGFAFHTANKTRRARQGSPDREGSSHAAMRSAGHALIEKRRSQVVLGQRLKGEAVMLHQLTIDLKTPVRTRRMLKNLEPMRVFADEKIHETVEVAMLNSALSNDQIMGLHKAVREELYGDMPANRRAQNWIERLSLAGVHTLAKLHKLRLSYENCGKELAQYQPYLDDKAAQTSVLAVA